MNYHKSEPIKTQVVDRAVYGIIVNDTVNPNRGALSFRKQVHALIFRKQMHALIFENKIISKYLENMRFSFISACTFMRGDTVSVSKQNLHIYMYIDQQRSESDCSKAYGV